MVVKAIKTHTKTKKKRKKKGELAASLGGYLYSGVAAELIDQIVARFCVFAADARSALLS